ncbi:MAG TPA: hypothetical protein VK167_02300 [Flavipsychrobacter sp.]|nr:hypothetical protein [Flavipsychrobacter sp.]
MGILIFIVIIVLVVILTKSSGTFQTETKQQGGVKHLYRDLINLILSIPSTEIVKMENLSVEILWKGDLISAKYKIMQVDKNKVTVIWTTNMPVQMVHENKIAWQFNKEIDQEAMFQEIQNDIELNFKFNTKDFM